jgi:hypothetical protein
MCAPCAYACAGCLDAPAQVIGRLLDECASDLEFLSSSAFVSGGAGAGSGAGSSASASAAAPDAGGKKDQKDKKKGAALQQPQPQERQEKGSGSSLINRLRAIVRYSLRARTPLCSAWRALSLLSICFLQFPAPAYLPFRPNCLWRVLV